MCLILRVLALLLRVIMFYSPVAKKFSGLLIFEELPYSLENLKECKFLRNNIKMTNSEIYFNSELIQNILYFIEKDIISILFFSLLDVSIGIAITKISNYKNSKINYLELIYLFNPISILSCIKFKLDIFFIFVNLMFVLNRNNFMGVLFFIIGLFSSPGFIFINLSLAIYFITENNSEFIKKFIFKSLLAIILIYVGIYLKDFTNIPGELSNFVDDMKMIYSNYYRINDTLPNIGLLWYLIPETFLKFRNFSCLMLVNYQILFNIAILSLMKGLDFRNKDTLFYSLIFLINHIIDRYPSQLNYTISILLIVQNFELIKNNIFHLAIFGSFAGFTLIFSRGHPYRFKRSGSSNFLFFQNLTYECFLIFVMLFVIISVFNHKKNIKHQKKMNVIVNGIIEKAITQIS